jgi:adenine-specific DNA glycosylase
VKVVKTLLLIFFGRQVAVERSREGMLQGMYLFPELPGHLSPEEAVSALRERGLETGEARELGSARHVFTHRIWEMKILALRSFSPGPWHLVTREELLALPMPAAEAAARQMALSQLEGGHT